MTGAHHPPVLVVTPTFGRSPYLAAALASVHGSGVPVQHVVVVPPAGVAAVRALCPQCAIVLDETPEGIYAALAKGINAAAPWEWFTYLNDDDVLTPEFGRMAEQWKRTAAFDEIAYGDVRWIDARGRNLGLMPVERHADRFSALMALAIAPFTQQGALVSREAFTSLGGFDTAFTLAADFDFWVRALEAGLRFKYHPRELAQWRIHNTQASMDRSRAVTEARQVAATVQMSLSPVQRRLVRFRFFAQNAPRYLERLLASGRVTSNGVFANAGTDS